MIDEFLVLNDLGFLPNSNNDFMVVVMFTNNGLKAVLAYYIFINVLLFVLMGIDKLKAKKRKWRIPESALFTIAILGGAIGGFAGMFVFRHKSRKLSFKVIYAISLFLHILLLFFIFN